MKFLAWRKAQLTPLVGLMLVFGLLVGIAYGVDGRVLERGMKGSDVLELQRQLAELGYGVKPDGVFGPETERAVKQFQADFNLTVDGIVGPKTLRSWEKYKDISNMW